MPVANPVQYQEMIARAKDRHYALPAINVTSLETLNAAIDGLVAAGSDGIIQFSTGAGEHASGSAKDAALGTIALAEAAHRLAAQHKIMIALHTDHCTPKKADSFLGPLLDESDRRRALGLPPLFNGHMFDGSELELAPNLEQSKKWHKRCVANGIVLEMEIGVVGGVEEGAAGAEGNHAAKLYTTPEDMVAVYEAFQDAPPGSLMVAATFGNVHGMYKPGNVKLDPQILAAGQAAIKEKYGVENALSLVFHGGSGTPVDEIHQTLDHGIIKMNVDTETQAAFATGVYDYTQAHKDGFEQWPMDKKVVDPRKIVGAGAASMAKLVSEVAERLRSNGQSMYEEFAARSVTNTAEGNLLDLAATAGQQAGLAA